MGLDLDALWGQAREAANTGMNDLLKSGGNAAIGYLEGQAINVIHADQVAHVKDAQVATQDILSRPTSAGSFGAYLSGITQNAAVKQYGTPIMIGVVVIGLAAVLLFKR